MSVGMDEPPDPLAVRVASPRQEPQDVNPEEI
jgi:hypothetical protein